MTTQTADALEEYVRKYARSGILLDTNLLLMYVVGRYDPQCIETFKRTNTFTRKDYKFLCVFLQCFQKVVATPHVLTEVSNLAAHLNEPHKTRCFESIAKDIDVFDEQTEAAGSMAKSESFARLGLTDASFPLIAKNRFLVLTADLVLYDYLWRSGVDAINFNHIRLQGWA